VTALNPYIGYANATEIAQEALVTAKASTIWCWQGSC
jgi:aspartate ammonia-lyase